MPRSIPWRQRNCRGIIRGQTSRALIKLPDENPIQPQIGVQNEAARGIRLNHVRVRSVVSAEGEASRRSMGGLFRSHGAGFVLDVRGGPKAAVRQNRQHRHRAAKVVGHQHKLSRWMDAQIGRASSARTHGVKETQLPVSSVNRKGADSAFVGFAHPVRLIGRIQARAGSIQSQAVRAGSRFIHTGWRQGSGGAVHLVEVNATAIPRRQIHLGRQHIAERRAESAYVGHERGLPSG